MNAGLLRNWSFSTLVQYEGCPMRVKLGKIDKLPEPPRDPDNDPLARGDRIHKNLEAFVKGEEALSDEARGIKEFRPLLERAQILYVDGKATVEEDWLFDENWQPCSRDNRWLWAKLDLNVHNEAINVSVVVDYKSGKSAYKAVEHVQQMQIYALGAALRQPWAHKIVVELWYVDEGHIKAATYTRDQALYYIKGFQTRADRLMSDTRFRPNPTTHTCRWCPYSPRGTGACPVGI